MLSSTLIGCAKLAGSEDQVQLRNAALSAYGPKDFFSTMDELKVEVAYEPGAIPFTATRSNSMSSYWNILETNLNKLFEKKQKKPIIFVPKTTSEMTALPEFNKSSWSAQDVADIALQYRRTDSSPKTGSFFIVFLRGYFKPEGEASSTSTIGIQITGTTIIAIFKDVVQSLGNSPNNLVQIYTEQSTLVHEMGHALGLVNNGIPMHTNHQDHQHGTHCTNPDCVMYWLNEGSGDLQSFVQKMIRSGNTNLFGSECLADIENFNP